MEEQIDVVQESSPEVEEPEAIEQNSEQKDQSEGIGRINTP